MKTNLALAGPWLGSDRALIAVAAVLSMAFAALIAGLLARPAAGIMAAFMECWMTRADRRFNRQIARIERALPRVGRLLAPGSRVRMPAAVLLMLGGMLGFLPVLGFWMLPLGLLLLAVDWPRLRPGAASLMVRMRQLSRRLQRRVQAWRAGTSDQAA